MIQSYRELELWQRAEELGHQVFTATFPQYYFLDWSRQLRCAAVGVSSALAAGCATTNPKDFLRNLRTASRFAAKAKSLLVRASIREVLNTRDYQQLAAGYDDVQRMAQRLTRSMRQAPRLSVVRVLVAALVSVGLFLGIRWFFPTPAAWAQLPHLIRYQGQAVDNQGVPLEGPYDLTFRLYDASTSGTKLWEETQSGIALTGGRFSVLLGQKTALNPDWTKPCWLSVQIGQEAPMTPRQQISSVPIALVAEHLDGPICTINGRVGVGTKTPNASFQLGNVDANQYNGYHFVIGKDEAVLGTLTSWASQPWAGTNFGFERGRGTSALPATVQQGDVLGVLYWAGQVTATPGDRWRVASIKSIAETNFSSAIHSAAMTFATALNAGQDEEKMRLSGEGYLGIGTTNPTNILTVQRSSPTDPIADSWTTYSCDRQHKDLLRPIAPAGYLSQLREVPLYEWRWKPLVSDDEAEQALDRDASDPMKKTRPSKDRIDAKKRELAQAKSMLPKFSTKRLGMSIDDPNVPQEILTRAEDGTPVGIDLLAYLGYLHAALKEAALKLDELEARVGTPGR